MQLFSAITSINPEFNLTARSPVPLLDRMVNGEEILHADSVMRNRSHGKGILSFIYRSTVFLLPTCYRCFVFHVMNDEGRMFGNRRVAIRRG